MQEIVEEFDYSKLTEETEAMMEWAEQTLAEIAKMKGNKIALLIKVLLLVKQFFFSFFSGRGGIEVQC